MLRTGAEEGHRFRERLDIRAELKKKRGGQNKTWLHRVAEQNRKVGRKNMMPMTNENGDRELMLYLAR